MTTDAPVIRSLRWEGDIDGQLVLIDQTCLPLEYRERICHDVASVIESIRSLRVRGAPAIGIAAAYGVCLAGQTPALQSSVTEFQSELETAIDQLAASRPTAVNLFWALDRMRQVVRSPSSDGIASLRAQLLVEARRMEEQDRHMCRAIGEHGATLIPPAANILTHCNTGGLATAEYGTALGVILTAHLQGKAVHVFVDETRPLLQGARLTAWELQRLRIPCTLICDSMAAQVMKVVPIDLVITGADRIAANGDTANKIGTYGLAVLAQAHGIPFYVAAPTSTFDLQRPDGGGIPIEQRDPGEVTHGFGRVTAPDDIAVYNPAFDVTPASLIHGIVTEKGVITPVDEEHIRRVIGCGDRLLLQRQ